MPTLDSRDIELLDIASITLNYRKIPANGSDCLPLYGVAKFGIDKYPETFGSYKIDPSVKWKVIGISENPKRFTKTLKLRVAGLKFGDGVFF